MKLEPNTWFDEVVKTYHIIAPHIHHTQVVTCPDLNEELGRDENDFAILCANCHRMIHKYGCPSLDEFKGKIQVDYKNFLKDK